MMILGALAISTAAASAEEHTSTNQALLRECNRYNLDYTALSWRRRASNTKTRCASPRHWWDYLIVAMAIGLFVWFAWGAAHASVGHEYELGRGIVRGSRRPALRSRMDVVEADKIFLADE